MEKLTLALFTHDSRENDLISLLEAHMVECSLMSLISTDITARKILSRTGLPVSRLPGNYPDVLQHVSELVAGRKIKAVIYLRDTDQPIKDNLNLLSLLQTCDENEIPFATSLASSEAVIHLLDEHPEAIAGHHIAARYLEEMAWKHD